MHKDAQGSSLTIKNKTAIRVKRPFFVTPSGNRGHRIVIDMVPAPKGFANIPNTRLVASLDGSGALPRNTKVEVAQISGSQNPYIQRAFPQAGQPQGQAAPRPAQQRMVPQNMPVPRATPTERIGFLGLRNTYFRGSLGLHLLSETHSEGGGDNYDAEFQPGFGLSGAIGTELDNGFRLEGEFLYSNASLKQISGTAVSTVYNTEVVDGDVSTIAFMGNAAYDFPHNSRLTPFIMGGVGFAGIFLNDLSVEENAIADDMDWVFAMQLGAGVTFALDNRTKIEIGYRYFETQDPEFSNKNGTPYESIYASHNFLVGARIDLN